MGLTPAWFGILLAFCALVAILARKVRLPYTVGLVISGAILAALHTIPDIELTRQFIFDFLLPPLIFEASLYISWPMLRKDFGVISTLAILGVVIAATVTGACMHWLANWQWPTAIVFGVLISATDPVSVIALFKEAKVGGRLQLLMEAESLFNDGTAAVLFGIVTVSMVNQGANMLGGVGSFVEITAGGVICGLLVGGLALLIAGRTGDHLVETTMTMIAAYGSFWLADRLHLSGVLATLSAGILIGNYGFTGALTNRGRLAAETFWEVIAFIANSLIFILIGLHLAHTRFDALLVTSIIAAAAVLLGRIASVYPCAALFIRSSQRIDMKYQHILFWGGLRGAIALALSLGLPSSFPQRDLIITTTFAVVAFSVIVQGVTVQPLLRKLGILDEGKSG
jgi:CPA1 family monovalent cation:H+ antiporter